MVSVHVSGLSGPGSSPGRGHCVDRRALAQGTYSHSASLHPGLKMRTSKLNTGGKPDSDGLPASYSLREELGTLVMITEPCDQPVCHPGGS